MELQQTVDTFRMGLFEVCLKGVSVCFGLSGLSCGMAMIVHMNTTA